MQSHFWIGGKSFRIQGSGLTVEGVLLLTHNLRPPRSCSRIKFCLYLREANFESQIVGLTHNQSSAVRRPPGPRQKTDVPLPLPAPCRGAAAGRLLPLCAKNVVMKLIPSKTKMCAATTASLVSSSRSRPPPAPVCQGESRSGKVCR